MKLRKKKMPKTELQCTDTCKHSIYIEEGDFICDVVNDVRIVGWKPFSCMCPKKRRIRRTDK